MRSVLRAWAVGAVLAWGVGGSAPAHAWSFKLGSVLLSADAGPQHNYFRFAEGTRRTPEHALHGRVDVDVTVLHSPWHPHRLSVFGGLEPLALASLGLPSQGWRPGLTQPISANGMFSDPALGLGALGGVRYRWETGFAVVPYAETGVSMSAHKVLRPGPMHLNLAVFGGGGVEYYLLHKVAFYAGMTLRGGLLVFPLPRVVPWPEASAEGVVGVRFRAF